MTWLITIIEPPWQLYHVSVSAETEPGARALARLAVQRRFPAERNFDDLFVLLVTLISDAIDQRQTQKSQIG